MSKTSDEATTEQFLTEARDDGCSARIQRTPYRRRSVPAGDVRDLEQSRFRPGPVCVAGGGVAAGGKVVQFPGKPPVRKWAPPEFDSEAESLAAATEPLITEAEAQLLHELFADMAKLVRLFQDASSTGGR